MSNIFSLKQEIFNKLRDYINANYTLTDSCEVKQYTEDNVYPLIVFSNNSNLLSNRTIDNVYQTRSLTFTIEIYAITIGKINSLQICEELANLCDQVMRNQYRMGGGLDARMTNINTAKASKYVLHYDCKWQTNKHRII